MDPAKEKHNPNPREGANIFSMLFFWYTIDIFKKGMKKTLDVDDIYNPLEEDRSALLGDKLEINWSKELQQSKVKSKSPSLLKVILQTFWFQILKLGLLIGLGDIVVRISQPYILGLLLDYYNPVTSTTKEEALWYASGLVIVNLTTSFIRTQYGICASHVGIKIRAGVCSLIYRKAAKLSQNAIGINSTGKIVNLLSNDVARIDTATTLLHEMWVGPLTALIILYFVFTEVGLSGTPGVLIILAIMPIQVYVGRLSARYRKQTALRTDERIRLMDEVICGIQVIKMYAWEKPFAKLIAVARKAEIKIIRKGAYMRGFFMAFSLFSNRFALFATLISMALSGQPITAAKVFVFMSYFRILAQSLAGVFARGLTAIAELLVSIRRLQDFLTNEEYDFGQRLQNANHQQIREVDISLHNVTASWNKSSDATVLNNINLEVPREKLIGITGPVGSGKSSLLQTILGELNIIKGDIRANGTLSYASQEPWVFSGTIRQNILFGAEYNRKRYNEVVHVCALEKDFDQFPKRDNTLIGDKGASLSGGQKARVNLARAVYRDRDIYLLDDPLSAVDSHVSKVLYEACINKFLAGKTRILVTHQVHCLNNADHIIILNNGDIEQEGTFNELAKGNNLFAQLLTEEHGDNHDEKKKKDFSRSLSEISSSTIKSRKMSEHSEKELDAQLEESEVTRKELQEESSEGKISGSLLFKYFLSGMTYFNVFLLFFLIAFAQAVSSGIEWFISFWTSIEEYRNVTLAENESKNIPSVNWSTETCLYIYGVALTLLLIATLSRSITFYKLLMKCSISLHGTLFNGVIRAPMRFFHTNPSGRILNRFSKDIGVVDEALPRMLFENFRLMLHMAGALVLVVYISPYSLILLAILCLIFSFMRRVYLKSSKNIKRLEGRMRSPVFTHLSATLQGLTTIRALNAEDILKEEFDRHQDYHTSAFFMFVSTSSAFGFSLDLCCITFVGVITLGLTALGDYFGMTGGQVGLAITQATNLCSTVQFAMMSSSEIINQLMSVERVLEYQALASEEEVITPTVPPKTWPDKGNINFTNLHFKYFEEGPDILQDLSFSIKENDKVGIVGRTGAGKSSLIAAILRLALIEGKIEIDGVNTKDLSLENLRSKISVIPQDPVLFSGTLRYNLDPFGEYTDEMLYRALNEVELKDPANIMNQLENRVMDRGGNYSVGQKQLICLARAILRNNKILMLDEATANVDPQTDALIQKTIRTNFANCTVLTVAHRLNTIMDSDKVLVIDAGQVVEYDHPHILLQNSDSFFYKLVAETNTGMVEQFHKIAAESYYKKFSTSPS